MPTIGAYIQNLPGMYATTPYQCSAGTVFNVIEGGVTVVTQEKTFEVGPNDVFVIPSWAPHQFKTSEDTVLFSFSDRPVQEALGLWREQRTAG